MKPTKFLLTLMVACFGAISVLAVPYASRHGMTAAEYQAEFNKWTQSPYNYRLLSVDGYEHGGQVRYAAVWAEQSGPNWITHPGLTKPQFDALNAGYAGNGFYPVFLSAFGVGNAVYYNAIWESSPGADVIPEVGLLYHDYVAMNALRLSQGYKLVQLWTCNAGANEYFAGIWRKGDPADYEIRVRQTGAEYQQEFGQLGAEGYQLVAISAAVVAGEPLYTSVWKQPGNSSAWYGYHGLTGMNYQGESWNAHYQGYRPVFASVFNPAGGERFNVIFQHNGGMNPAHLALINDAITDYMDTNDVPGLSLAISRDGQLVYAKGWGQADQAADEWVHPHHRFRIASVSKPITAAAVVKLADLCGLNLDATVFGPGALLGNSFGTPPYSVAEEAITLRQLLYHTAGWDTDGIWQVGTDDPDDAIDWQLDNASGEPVNTPGTAYDYMNIGYAVAGRVIEKRSGRSYEKFVQDELLAPSCVTEMEIGGRTLAERKPGEVVYYQSYQGSPYNLSPRRMDAHGGWIAKPIDLLLLLRRMDGNTNNAELLTADGLTEMLTPSGAPGGGGSYGLGLGIGGGGWGHNGAMPGTIADLSYRNDGLAFAVTCNVRPQGDEFVGVLKSIIMDLIDDLNAANAWPNYDLFPCNVPPGDSPQTMEVTRDIYVDWSCNSLLPDGQKNCNLLGGPFKTVNQGANEICAGDRLFIRAGVYDEAVTLDRYTTVRSYDGAATVGD
jgi:CubicO group peptidase (beta-lactamase class C family)